MTLKKRPYRRNLVSGQYKVSLTPDEATNIDAYDHLQIMFEDGGVSRLITITDKMKQSIESMGDYHLMSYKGALKK